MLGSYPVHLSGSFRKPGGRAASLSAQTSHVDLLKEGSKKLRERLDARNDGKTNIKYLGTYFNVTNSLKGGGNPYELASAAENGQIEHSIYGTTPSINRMAFKSTKDLQINFNKNSSM